jgi:hypothetical protein
MLSLSARCFPKCEWGDRGGTGGARAPPTPEGLLWSSQGGRAAICSPGCRLGWGAEPGEGFPALADRAPQGLCLQKWTPGSSGGRKRWAQRPLKRTSVEPWKFWGEEQRPGRERPFLTADGEGDSIPAPAWLPVGGHPKHPSPGPT